MTVFLCISHFFCNNYRVIVVVYFPYLLNFCQLPNGKVTRIVLMTLNLTNYTSFPLKRHKPCNLVEAWLIYSLLSIEPFGGTCGSCRPLRLDTGVLVGLVWTDPVRMFALRDRWCVRNEHKAFYLKKCWWSSHKPGQNTVRLTQNTLVRGH